jgi:hypothetical protein
MHSTSAAASTSKGTITIVAIADDVKVFVIRDVGNVQSAYAIGDRIADSDWRVTHVSGGKVTLEATPRFVGKKLEMHLTVGQSVDLHAMPTVSQPVSQHVTDRFPDAKR